MTQPMPLSMAIELMTEFALHTGLSPSGKTPRRYLWTDAFAVCNFLQLYQQTGQEHYRKLALLLVDQVHHILGRHRADDSRSGWLSGLEEQQGELHPTQGGLRIGKQLPERDPAETIDDSLEWDRDGQYYHYLSKWMHALNRVSRVTEDNTYHRWAVELAKTAHQRFTYKPPMATQKAMYWKMSIDLSRPLVTSMGQHDPIDGLISYIELQTGADNSPKSSDLNLDQEIRDMQSVCTNKSWVSDDPLGIGGLLCDAYKVVQMVVNEGFKQVELLQILLDASLVGLEYFSKSNSLNYPLDYRLAFRELGLSIGLKSIIKLQALVEGSMFSLPDRQSVSLRIDGLLQYSPMIEQIDHFWLEAGNRASKNWLEHQDINTVMLATSLVPDGFLSV